MLYSQACHLQHIHLAHLFRHSDLSAQPPFSGQCCRMSATLFDIAKLERQLLSQNVSLLSPALPSRLCEYVCRKEAELWTESTIVTATNELNITTFAKPGWKHQSDSPQRKKYISCQSWEAFITKDNRRFSFHLSSLLFRVRVKNIWIINHWHHQKSF